MGQDKEVSISLRINTILDDMGKTANKLSEGLNKGISKIDVGSSIGKSLTKNIQNFKEEYNKFSQLTKGGTSVNFGDSKEAISSGNKLIKLYRDIQAQVKTMGESGVSALKKMFPDAFDSRIDGLKGKLVSLQSAMLAINSKQLQLTEAQDSAKKYETDLENLRSQMIDTKDQVEALARAEKDLSAAKTDQDQKEQALLKVQQAAKETKDSFVNLKNEMLQKINVNAESVVKDIDKIEKEIDDLNKKKIKLTAEGDAAGADKVQKEIEAKQQERAKKGREHKTLLTASANTAKAKTPEALAGQIKHTGQGAKEQQELLNRTQELGKKQAEQAAQQVNAERAVAEARLKTTEATTKQEDAARNLEAANKSNNNIQTQIERTTQAYEKQQARVSQLSTELGDMQTKISTKGLADLKELIPGFDAQKLATTQGIQEIIGELDRLDNEKADQVRQELTNLGLTGERVEAQVGSVRNGLVQIGQGTADIARASKEMDQLRHRMEYFFGITNSIQLFKRAIRSAMSTVKELDATMTEAAVVTDFSVGDMWDKLPQYAKEAKKLGVSINSMYQATTLYYQQGLDTNEAMALGVETMKMARIAGMDAKDATNAMTAALRGFNMELNEMSAVRVNDVYSQLAAITAADVSQISTAMEKTASIAASANMEFETTAALLAQIIETTQEAPETAGTAMKTIIARFSEAKTLREKGASTGEDEEGEAIDVNKIQTALKKVGISMQGFFAGTEGLDSILLKLAEKWGDLDFETQRYIATMAAGSRQQSRFIAMMSDYERTVELVDEAQNSSGASQEQFEKTQESLATSLNRLQAAWQEFLMGLANNEILRGAVDALTFLVEQINKLIDLSSGLGGTTKSITSLVVALGALKLGKGLLVSVGLMQKSGAKAGFAYQNGFQRAIKDKKLSSFFLKPQIDQKALQKQLDDIFNNKLTLMDGQNQTIPTDQVRQSFQDIYNQTGSVEEALSGVQTQFGIAGDSIETLKTKTAGLEDATKRAGISFTALGTSAMGVGMAFSLIGNMIGGEFGGWLQRAGQIASSLGMALIGLQMIFPKLAIAGMGAGKALEKGGKAASKAWLWLTLAITVASALWALFSGGNDKGESQTEKMKRLNGEADALKKAAEGAAEQLKKLDETKKGLGTLETKMNNLVKGTKEWTEALIENNNQVIELMDQYSLLSENGYIQKDAEGKLTIVPKGYEQIEEELTNRKQSAEISRIATEMAIDLISLEQQDEELQELEDNPFFGALGGVTEADYARLENLVAQTNLKNEVRLQELVGRKLSTIEGFQNDQNAEIISDALTLAYKDLASQLTTGDVVDEIFGKKDQFEATVMLEYYEMTGMTSDQVYAAVEAGELTWEAVARQVEINRLLKDVEKETENWSKALAKMSEESKKQLGGLLAGGITLSVKDLFSMTEDDISGLVAEAGITAENVAEYGYDNLAQLYLDLKKAQVQGREAAISAEKKFSSNFAKDQPSLTSILTEQFSDTKITAEITQGFANIIDNIVASGGNYEEFIAQLSSVYQNSAYKEELMEIFTSTDWQDKTDRQAAIESMEALGLVISEDFVDKIKDATGEINKIDMSEIKEKTKSLNETMKAVADKVSSGETVFDEETYKKLIEAGVNEDLFVQIGFDEYVYMDETNKLLTLIQKDVSDIAGGNINKVKAAVTAGLGYKKVIDEEPYIQLVEQEGEDGGTTYVNYTLSQLYSKYKSGNFSLERVVDSNTNLSDMALKLGVITNEEVGVYSGQALLKKIIEGYETYYLNLGKNQQLMKELMRSYGAEMWYNAIISGDAAPEGAENYKDTVAVNGRDYNVQMVLENYLTGKQELPEGFLTALGMPKGTQDERLWAEQYYNDVLLYNRALDAAIQATPGLGKLVDKFTEQIQNNGVAEEQAADAAKRLAVQYNNAHKNAKTLTESVKDLKDALNSEDEMVRNAAIAQLTARAKATFGDHFDENMVEQYLPLLLQLEQSGEAAAAAWKALSDASFTMALNQSGLEGDVLVDVQEIYDTLANTEVGISVALDEDSVELVKSNWNAIMNALAAGGIELVQTKDDQGTIIGIEAVRTGGYLGTRTGGGGSKWENSYDKQYNTYEKINSLLRIREKIEREYDRILENRAKSGRQLLNNTKEQLKNLQQQKELQEYLQGAKMGEIEELMASNSKFSKYVTGFDKATGTIQIDWNEINKIKNSDRGSEVSDYISKLEGLRDQWQEAQDALEEIEDSVKEIQDDAKDGYFELEDKLKEALINERQKEIDRLTDINDSINDTNSKILDSMQQQIDEYRQNRDNEKTEKELEDKQRRLAYLQQDTSGANATEILQLQKEIEEGQESYTDQLIDQKISELQKQNDQAAEQRERQISLLETQLEHYQSSNEIWSRAYELMQKGISKDGVLLSGSDLEKILKESEEFSGLSMLGKEEWMNELATTIKKAFVYIEGGYRRAQEGQSIDFKNAAGQTLSGTADKEGNITVGDEVYKGVHQNEQGQWITSEKQGERTVVEATGMGSGKIGSLPRSTSLSSSNVKSLQSGLNELLDDGVLDFEKLSVDGSYGPKTKQAVRILQQALSVPADGIWGPNTYDAFRNSALKAYKSGGLADFTGPAWLDGTKSKPEYILNADQTKAFFTLVDILSGITSNPAKTAEKNGDNLYDIDINVESIGSDYDVEQMANKIKSLINEDARYRNNNAINLMR